MQYLKNMKHTMSCIHQHGIRVGVLSYHLSKHLNLPEIYWFLHFIAGRWHDFGKLLIPTSILNQPTPLTSEQWEIMKKHPIYSYRLVSLCGFDAYIKKAILYHHENECGTGYPFGLASENIPLSSKIIRICDIYDALTQKRVYKHKLNTEEAFSLMDKDKSLPSYLYGVFKYMILSDYRCLTKKELLRRG